MAAQQVVPDQALLAQGIAPNYGAIQQQYNAEEDARVAKQQRIDNYNNWLASTIAGAPTIGSNYAASIGLNPSDPGIASIINQISQTIGARAPRDQESGNPEQYFSPDAFQQGFNDFESRSRRANVSQVRNAFAPGYENTLLPDSAVDDIVNKILGEQQGLAQTKLGYQQKRGLLNPVGVQQAETSLGNQATAAKSTLGSLGQNVLSKDRSALTDIIAQAGDAASSWMLGNSPFSVDPYRQQLQDKATREQGSLEGDVRSALGNTQLFDIPTLIAQAGTAQGADNLNFGSVPGGSQPKKNVNRGLGSTGGGF